MVKRRLLVRLVLSLMLLAAFGALIYWTFYLSNLYSMIIFILIVLAAVYIFFARAWHNRR